MSQPKAVEAGRTCLVTRRVVSRFFLFRPDADGTMQNIFVYCLGAMALLFGIKVHAVVLIRCEVRSRSGQHSSSRVPRSSRRTRLQ